MGQPEDQIQGENLPWGGVSHSAHVWLESLECSATGCICQQPLRCAQDLKFPPRGMEGQTNPASWPWFQLMSDALEGRLAGKASRVTPSWSGEEDNVFGSSPSADRDCLLLAAERGSVSELESVVGGDSGEAEGNVAYTDASGEEGSAPSDPSYKSTS